jgi:integrating conjugative element protein (TIGR03761 family)
MADAGTRKPLPPASLHANEAEEIEKIRVGKLQACTTLTLETLQSRLLFNGRREQGKKDRIVGLRGFGSLLTAIWHGAEKDCPWAWMKLLQVQETLDRQRATLRELTQEAESALGTAPGLSHAEAHSIEPLVLELRFSTPYSYIGASLLSEYDRLVRLAMQAQHVGRLTDKQAYRLINKGGRAVRGAFESAFGYKFSGVTTQDLLQGNAKGQEKVGELGEVPEKVLKGLKRPEFTPRPVAAFSPRYFNYGVRTSSSQRDDNDQQENKRSVTS